VQFVRPRSSIVMALTASVVLLARAPSAGQAPAAGDPQADAAAKALLAVRDADPLELARVVLRVHDAAVLALLDDARPVPVRIAALRASRFLRQPELALAALPRWIESRDGELAEAAARAAFAIASQLDADILARRESDLGALASVAVALHAVERHAPWARADLIALAHAAAAQLEAAGVSGPAPR
jgi:hypothetical protein